MNLSVIIPCLNEIETIEICLIKCFESIKKLKINQSNLNLLKSLE